jgi:hypothetical protein
MSARPKRKSARTRKISYEDPERPPSPFPSLAWVDPKQSGFIDSLRKASVLQKNIEKETALLGEEWEIEGYVVYVGTTDSTTHVMVVGDSSTHHVPNLVGWPLQFPPNDPKYLAELVRAQSHPHLRVFARGILPKKGPIRIDWLGVFLDYGYEPILDQYLPPFDVRETKPAIGQLKWW